MKRITPFLWFDSQAAEAAQFYVSIFPNSKILSSTPGGNGKPMTVSMELDGQELVAFNGGTRFTFSEATSFVVMCKDQGEIDFYWSRLLADGGEESMCGWLKDRFGVSWQVIPENMGALLRNQGAVTAMLGMRKLDIRALEEAGK